MRVSDTGIDVQSVMLTVIVMVIVFYTGLAVMQTVTDAQIEELENQDGEIEAYCGLGCGMGFWDFVGPLLITGVLSFVVSFLVSVPKTLGPDDTNESDAKQLYIEGEISLLELEERLEDDINEDDL